MDKNPPRPPRWDPLVFALCVISLLAGWLVRGSVLAATAPFEDKGSGIAFRYPSSWMAIPADKTVVTIVNPSASGVYRSRIAVAELPPLPRDSMLSPEKTFLITRCQQFTLFRLLGERDLTVGATRFHEIHFAYADDPYKDDPSRSSLPVIIKERDLLFTHRDRTYLLSFSAESPVFDEDVAAMQRVLETLELR